MTEYYFCVDGTGKLKISVAYFYVSFDNQYCQDAND